MRKRPKHYPDEDEEEEEEVKGRAKESYHYFKDEETKEHYIELLHGRERGRGGGGNRDQ